MLLIAAALTVLVGLAHSWLGEKKILRPLLKLDGLPAILGGVHHTKMTLRVAWHVLTLVWCGLAAMMVYLHVFSAGADIAFLWMTSAVFGVSGMVSLIAGRGAHLSWIAFLLIAALVGYAAYGRAS